MVAREEEGAPKPSSKGGDLNRENNKQTKHPGGIEISFPPSRPYPTDRLDEGFF